MKSFFEVNPTVFGAALAMCILAVLLGSPVQAIDLAVARVIYAGFDNSWLASSQTVEIIGNSCKAVCIAVVLFGVGRWVVCGMQGNREETGKWGAFVCSVALCVFVTWLLRGTSGVPCPWSVGEFGSKSGLSAAIPFAGGVSFAGGCWPAANAGCGFVLSGLALVYADNRFAMRSILLTTTLFGAACAVLDMLQGAQFMSHAAASFLIDWTLSVAVFAAFNRLPQNGARIVSANTAAAASSLAIALTVLPVIADVFTIGADAEKLSFAAALFMFVWGSAFALMRFCSIAWSSVIFRAVYVLGVAMLSWEACAFDGGIVSITSVLIASVPAVCCAALIPAVRENREGWWGVYKTACLGFGILALVTVPLIENIHAATLFLNAL